MCLALTLACTGQIGDPPPFSGSPGGTGNGSSGTGSTGTSGPGGTGTGVPPPPMSCGDPANDIDNTPLRRLTNAEYLNTVSDLLGDVSGLNLDFAVELTTEGYPFLNNAGVQQTPPELAHQYLNAAEKIAADTVTNRLSKVLTCDPVAAGELPCAKTFISAFASKAFRRPVDADQSQALLSVWQVGRDTGDFKMGVQSVITAVLQMPEFLYRFEMSPASGSQKLIPLDGWDMATRLSYLLWNTGPDDALIAAAQAGKLTTAADVSAQVMRMMNEPRAREMVLRFHDQWLQLANIGSLEKDPMVYPKFSPAVATAMQQEVRSIVDAVVFQGDGKIGGLFTAPYTFLNDALGKFYGVSGLGPTFTRVDQTTLGMRPAAGILTAGGLLAAHADRNNTSPTKRGIFVREALLCEGLPPPPPNAVIVPPVTKPNQTRRQAMIDHVTNTTCAACHVMMDPIGFGFEGFDASGAWRTIENGQPIDASGTIMGSDVAGTFNGPVELAAKLATSNEALSCLATQWFRFAFGRDVGATPGDKCALTQLHDALQQGGALALVRAIPLTAPFLYRKVPQGGL
jgi:uncharacterized protein DUF1592/uncharacterized protein DUF1588/uncharacterized protein DUF1595/uncharacterized protein DUF1587/uncharacterized protein DUF1585